MAKNIKIVPSLGIIQLSGSNANTSISVSDDGQLQFGSVTSTGSLNLSGDLVVDGAVTAREFKTEFVSASIIYRSGSTKFGDTSDDVHEFTGSVDISSGSLTVDTGADNEWQIQARQYGHIGWNGGARQYLKGWSGRITAVIGNTGEVTRTDFTGFGIFKTPTNALSVNGNADISGNVGIGTTTPSQALHVSGNIQQTGATDSLYLINGNEFRGSNNLSLRALNSFASISAAGSIFYTAGTDHIFRDTNSNTLVTIKQDGNVGIAPLHHNQSYIFGNLLIPVLVQREQPY